MKDQIHNLDSLLYDTCYTPYFMDSQRSNKGMSNTSRSNPSAWQYDFQTGAIKSYFDNNHQTVAVIVLSTDICKILRKSQRFNNLERTETYGTRSKHYKR